MININLFVLIFFNPKKNLFDLKCEFFFLETSFCFLETTMIDKIPVLFSICFDDSCLKMNYSVMHTTNLERRLKRSFRSASFVLVTLVSRSRSKEILIWFSPQAESSCLSWAANGLLTVSATY